jgi:Rad3-related DNA helicase
MNVLPDPIYLGMPPKFVHWRPGQAQAVVTAADSTKRAVVLNQPTGSGKSAVYVARALLTGARTAILTATKDLQSQLLDEFAEECGLRDLRGQANYPCIALAPGGFYRGLGLTNGQQCDSGPCHVGAACDYRYHGCHYFDALRRARSAQLLVTNYQCWLAIHRYGEGLGHFDLLVMDEAHRIADELAASLEVHLSDYDVHLLLDRKLPDGVDFEQWKQWAIRSVSHATYRLDELDEMIREEPGDRSSLREAHALRGLMRQLRVIAEMDNWVVERRGKFTAIAPVWPRDYAEQLLFLGIPKLMFVSATIETKSMELIGLKADEFEYHEYPSSFPAERRPVIHVATGVRCRHDWTESSQRQWVRKIDQVIDRRLDRKGLIHSTSYEKRDLILKHSRHREIMLSNDGGNTRRVVDEFRRAQPPAVLVSPSLVAGWDLPGSQCEYQIIGKIPFPDTRSLITKARTEQDREYGPFLAMTTIIQSAGRGMRSERDQCETLVLDDTWLWFWPRYKRFAPSWFREAVRYSPTIPNPIPKL